jgi:foldase protein PrsA
VRYFLPVTLVILLLGCSSLFQDRSASPVAVHTELPAEEAAPAALGGATPSAEEAEEDRAFEQGVPLAGRVNDQPIFLADFENQVARLEQALAAQGLDLGEAEGQARAGRIRQQVFDTLLDQAIIEQQANRLEVQVEPAEVEAKAQETIAQVGSPEQFEAWLANNGFSQEAFMAGLQDQLLANALFDYITRNVPDRAEQVRIQYIRVEDQAVAETFIERLQQGEEFALVAETGSLDEIGGDLIWLSPQGSTLPPEVEEAAFALQPGAVSDPIQSGSSIYIVKLESREMDRPLPEDQFQRLKRDVFTDWLEEQRATAVVERFVEL